MKVRTLTIIILVILGAAALAWYIHLQRLIKLVAMSDQLASEKFDDAQEAMDWLAHYGRGAVPALNGLLQKRALKEYWPQQWRAAQVLAQIGDESSIQPLIDALGPDHATPVRAAAAKALGRLRAIEAKATLTDILDDKKSDLDLRCAAALALGRLGDKDAVGSLLAALAQRPPVPPKAKEGEAGAQEPPPPPPPPDETIPLRVAACQALGQIREPTSVNDLSAAADPDVEPSLLVQREAVAALGEIGSQDAIPTLLKRLQDVREKPGADKIVPDTDGDIRVAAAHALGQVGAGTPEVIAALQASATADRHYWVRLAAQESLERLR
jgi:hypothetical protein